MRPSVGSLSAAALREADSEIAADNAGEMPFPPPGLPEPDPELSGFQRTAAYSQSPSFSYFNERQIERQMGVFARRQYEDLAREEGGSEFAMPGFPRFADEIAKGTVYFLDDDGWSVKSNPPTVGAALFSEIPEAESPKFAVTTWAELPLGARVKSTHREKGTGRSGIVRRCARPSDDDHLTRWGHYCDVELESVVVDPQPDKPPSSSGYEDPTLLEDIAPAVI